MYPDKIQKLIEYLSKLPAVGTRTAEKYIFRILQLSDQEINDFSQAIRDLTTLNKCPECFNYTSEQNLCSICSNVKRSNKQLCVIADFKDLQVIENTHEFNGKYHILGGVLNPIEGITPDKLNIKSLLDRIKKQPVEEIILAFNPDLEGEATMILLKKLLHGNLKITRLARGLPMGADLEYADEVTLTNAFKGRRQA